MAERTLNFGADATDADYQIRDTSETGGDLVIEHLPTGATFEYDATENAWVPTDPIGTDARPVPGVVSDSVSTSESSITGTQPLTELTNDGAWVWFTDPRAVRYVGSSDKTYTGWVNSDGDVVVASVDHGNVNAVTTNTLKTALDPDDNANPALLIRPDGYIFATYSAHAGSSLYWRVSTNAEDITAFETESSSSDGNAHSYANPWQLTAETNDPIYVFYRRAGGNTAYIQSTDGGSTFGAEQEIIQDSEQIYFKIGATDSRVDFGLTKRVGGGHDHRNIRHCYLEGGTVYTSDGAAIGSPPISLADTTQVYDTSATGNHQAWVWDTAHYDDGTIAILFATFPEVDDHRLNYAEYDGTSWSVREIAAGGGSITALHGGQNHYSAGGSLSPDEKGLAYISIGNYDSAQVQQWSTDNGGKTWTHRPVSDEAYQNVRPAVPHNADESLPVLWMRGEYASYDNGGYNTAIVGGERQQTTPTVSPVRRGGVIAKDSAGRSLSSGGFTTMSWDTLDADSRNEFNGTDTVTVSKSGWYNVNVQVSLAGISGTGTVIASVFKNGSEEYRGDRVHVDGNISGNATVQASTVLWLAKGDSITGRVFQDTGGSISSTTAPSENSLTVVQHA